MGNIKFLHNLHKFCVGNGSGNGIEEMEKLAYLTGILHISMLENASNAGITKLNEKKSLDEVVFEWSNTDIVEPQAAAVAAAAQERVLEDLQPHTNIKKLRISNYQGFTFPSWIKDGPYENLFFVSLNGCRNCKILSLCELPRLRQLSIKGMKELENWPEVNFTSLDTLKIGNCPNIKEFPNDPNIFPNLRVLKIKSCSLLKALPLTLSLQFLVLVNNPLLEDWRECVLQLTEIRDGVPIITQRHSLSEVLELKIVSCPMLPGLPRYFAPQKLDIIGCDLVTTLQFNATRLQHLLVGNCVDGRLVTAIPNTNTMYSLVISNISNIASFPIWPNLPGLKALYIRNCRDLVSISSSGEQRSSLQSLSSLSLLSIRGCPKLQTILPEEAALPIALKTLIICSCPALQSIGHSDILTNLTEISDLYIENCTMLQSLPSSELPRSLKHLRIHRCPLIMEQCLEEDEGSYSQKIMHIPDLEIDAIQACSNSQNIVPISDPDTEANQIPSRAIWYHRFICCKGIDKREVGQPSNT